MSVTRKSGSSEGTARSLLVVGAALFLVFLLVPAVRKILGGAPSGQILMCLTQVAILWGLAFLVFVPGFLLAERLAKSWGRVASYGLVLLVGCALVATLVFPPLDLLGHPALLLAPPSLRVPRQFNAFLVVLLRVGLAACIYAFHRERLEAAQAVQVLETRRNEMMGRLAASRLEAARARVQPEAFIAELRTLRDTYVEDPATGAIVLESLITRLRVASKSAG
ncbi:MAG TPA: hypothetical protein VFN91_07030 [Myxococcaceae bacterium]|nr:hypothetical protein [Myxococcaceae bacterium]